MLSRKPPSHLSDEEKERHPDWRRYTGKYRKKRRIVRDAWLLSSALMVTLPWGLTPVIALATTFVSFMILDETA